MAFGRNSQFSNIRLLLQEQLDGMGDYLSQQVSSLAWCEAFAFARAMDNANKFVQLMANQLSPAESSILLDQWKTVYALSSIPDKQAETIIALKQKQFGTPPTVSNLTNYLQTLLGSIFINIQWAPELQPLATTDPKTQIIVDGYLYTSPLSTTYVYEWQSRDNQDNLLMSDADFINTGETYHQIVDKWIPSYTSLITMNLVNRGFQDGYANNHNGINFNNYLDGYNVISGTAGSTTITGVGTAFKTYPDGSAGDFIGAVNEGYYPPIQVVDDTGALQTYYVSAVNSNTSLIITVPLTNNITSRTYRALGIVMDTDGALDTMMFNS